MGTRKSETIHGILYTLDCTIRTQPGLPEWLHIINSYQQLAILSVHNKLQGAHCQPETHLCEEMVHTCLTLLCRLFGLRIICSK